MYLQQFQKDIYRDVIALMIEPDKKRGGKKKYFYISFFMIDGAWSWRPHDLAKNSQLLLLADNSKSY